MYFAYYTSISFTRLMPLDADPVVCDYFDLMKNGWIVKFVDRRCRESYHAVLGGAARCYCLLSTHSGQRKEKND